MMWNKAYNCLYCIFATSRQHIITDTPLNRKFSEIKMQRRQNKQYVPRNFRLSFATLLSKIRFRFVAINSYAIYHAW